jgi:transcription factor TGA
MNSTSLSTQLIASKTMEIYEPFHQVSMWEDSFKVDHSTLNSIASPMLKMNISSLENKVKLNSWIFILFLRLSLIFIWKLVHNSLLNFLFQSEYVPHESREPSGDDQESTEEPAPKVIK